MKKKIVLLTLVSMFLLSAMVMTSVVAQERIVGVNEVDWFKYGEINVNWSSNDPNATIPEWVVETNQTEWLLITVEDVSGTNIIFQFVTHYKNETEKTESRYIDIDTGEGNVTGVAISANLKANDTLYTGSTLSINETIARIYPDGVRETNHLNVTSLEETEDWDYYSENFYWDKSSGILVEQSIETINNKQMFDVPCNYSVSFRITESNVWVIPEFPTWTPMLLVFLLTVAIAITKRRFENNISMEVP